MKKGKIIVIEGVDGAGKTTQIELLKKELDLENNIFLKEPGSTLAGEKIREVILNFDLKTKTEVLLFYAARNELIRNIILPAIKEGKNVFIDRFELSTLAYQIYGRNNGEVRSLIEKLSEEIIPENFVDKYYFFDLDIEISKERERLRDEKSSRFDLESEEFFNRVREGYKKEIKRFNHKIIDASKSVEEVKEDFQKDLFNFLQKD